MFKKRFFHVRESILKNEEEKFRPYFQYGQNVLLMSTAHQFFSNSVVDLILVLVHEKPESGIDHAL